jgi:hypothetical protein
MEVLGICFVGLFVNGPLFSQLRLPPPPKLDGEAGRIGVHAAGAALDQLHGAGIDFTKLQKFSAKSYLTV